MRQGMNKMMGRGCRSTNQRKTSSSLWHSISSYLEWEWKKHQTYLTDKWVNNDDKNRDPDKHHIHVASTPPNISQERSTPIRFESNRKLYSNKFNKILLQFESICPLLQVDCVRDGVCCLAVVAAGIAADRALDAREYQRALKLRVSEQARQTGERRS